MTSTNQQQLVIAKEKLLLVSFFFFLYTVVYYLGKSIGMANAIKTSAGIVYLPAGARLLACLVGRGWGALGVGIATFLVVLPDTLPDQDTSFHLAIATINSLSVLISVLLMLKTLGIKNDLSNIKFVHLPIIDFVATFVQTTAYSWFLYLNKVNISIEDLEAKFLSRWTGNFLGGMVFMIAFFALVNIYKWHAAKED
jgi:integral membrane sensor domain MASE1